jgi:hypothetical protein
MAASPAVLIGLSFSENRELKSKLRQKRKFASDISGFRQAFAEVKCCFPCAFGCKARRQC